MVPPFENYTPCPCLCFPLPKVQKFGFLLTKKIIWSILYVKHTLVQQVSMCVCVCLCIIYYVLIGFIRIIIVSYAIVMFQVLFRYSYTGESLNLRKKTSKSVLYEQRWKKSEITILQKRFPELDYKSSAIYNDS